MAKSVPWTRLAFGASEAGMSPVGSSGSEGRAGSPGTRSKVPLTMIVSESCGGLTCHARVATASGPSPKTGNMGAPTGRTW
jgi:hypothetical protein